VGWLTERSGEGLLVVGNPLVLDPRFVQVPAGLPKAPQGGNAPENRWVFSAVAAARQSCAG